MADIYHLYISAPNLDSDNPELVEILDLASDWVRYGDGCWLLYTTSDAAKWYARLGDFVKAHKGHVFVIRVDITERQGWMPRRVWTWLREKQDKIY